MSPTLHVSSWRLLSTSPHTGYIGSTIDQQQETLPSGFPFIAISVSIPLIMQFFSFFFFKFLSVAALAQCSSRLWYDILSFSLPAIYL